MQGLTTSDHSVAVALIAAVASLIVALVAGGIALWDRRKTDKNTRDIQSLDGTMRKELERLRAKLAHGQSVSATQWSAEFAGYQAIWKGIVRVQPLAAKLVNRKDELREIGIPEGYLNSSDGRRNREDLTQALIIAANVLLSAIHDNAPFYPASIRDAANEVHKTAKQLTDQNLGAITKAIKGSDVAHREGIDSESLVILQTLKAEVVKTETLIRDRLVAVQVINP